MDDDLLYHVAVGDIDSGPLPEHRARGRAAQAISAGRHVTAWTDGWPDWRPATEVWPDLEPTSSIQVPAARTAADPRYGMWLLGGCLVAGLVVWGVVAILFLVGRDDGESSGAVAADGDTNLLSTSAQEAADQPTAANDAPPRPTPCRAVTEALWPGAKVTDGSYWEFEYDDHGRLRVAQGRRPNGSASQREEWEYTDTGARVTVSRGARRYVRLYERRGDAYLLSGPEDAASARYVPSYEYQFDSAGRPTSSVGRTGKVGAPERCTFEYGRDDARPFGRFSQGETKSTCDELNLTEIEYDDQGRIKTMTRIRVRPPEKACYRCKVIPGSEHEEWRMTFEYECG